MSIQQEKQQILDAIHGQAKILYKTAVEFKSDNKEYHEICEILINECEDMLKGSIEETIKNIDYIYELVKPEHRNLISAFVFQVLKTLANETRKQNDWEKLTKMYWLSELVSPLSVMIDLETILINEAVTSNIVLKIKECEDK